MTGKHDIDHAVLELVRRADPLRHEAGDDARQTEAALSALLGKLDRPARPARTRPHLALRARVLLCAVTAVAAVVAVAIQVSPGGTDAEAEARVTLHRAAAALTLPRGILEDVEVSTRGGSAGPTRPWEYATWTSTRRPFDSRERGRQAGRTYYEQTIVNGHLSLYDPSNNTIYREAPPHYDLVPGPGPRTERLTVAEAEPLYPGGALPARYRGTVTLTVSDAQARALRRGVATLTYGSRVTRDGKAVQTDPVVTPTGPRSMLDPNSLGASAVVRYMMRQPGTRVDAHASLDGSPAIEITSADGRFSYWVAPKTYRPLQVSDRTFPGVTRFKVYRVLTGANASARLLSLTAQHPTARIVTDGDAFARAEARLTTQPPSLR